MGRNAVIEALQTQRKPAPDPFDIKANALQPLMGPSDLIPEYVEGKTGSGLAGFLAGLVSPSGLLKGVKKGAEKLGMISAGGPKDLLVTHEMPSELELGKLLAPGERGVQTSLEAPSLAVSSIERPFDVESGVELFPNPRLVDPANLPFDRAALYPVDAFSYRREPSTLPGYLRNSARKDPRLTEDFTPAYGHLAAILTAKRYPSFRDYEKSAQGAERLPSAADNFQRFGKKVYDPWIKLSDKEIENWYKTQSGSFETPKEVIKAFLADPANKVFKEVAENLPQNYGELKYQGMLPLSAPYISAVKSHNFYTQELRHTPLQRSLQGRGIRLYGKDISRDEIVDALDRLHGFTPSAYKMKGK